jgi:glycosyltransferase involved in cell wall biosynthesis
LALSGSRVAESLREAGIEPLLVSSKGRALLGLPRLLRFVKDHDIGVIHCHKSSDLRLGALLATVRPGLRLFFTDHMGVTRPKKDLYHRWVYGKVTRLFSISEATRQRNLAAFPLPAARIRRLYLGIDTDDFAPRLTTDETSALRASLGIPEGAVAIGLPGRLTPGKGQELWIEALAGLAEEAPDLAWQGVLIGGLLGSEGSDEAYVACLRALVSEHGLEDSITFAGFRPDLPRLFEALDIVCVPSLNEAFGLTVIEAMAAGKVVIGADSGAIPELIDSSTGRLACPDSPRAWTEWMAILAGNRELRERLGRAARQHVLDGFTLKAHVAELVAEYKGQPLAES